MILLLVLNGKIETFIFCLRVVAIKTEESVTLVYTVRINKPEGNIAARNSCNALTNMLLPYFSPFFSSPIFIYVVVTLHNDIVISMRYIILSKKLFDVSI